MKIGLNRMGRQTRYFNCVATNKKNEQKIDHVIVSEDQISSFPFNAKSWGLRERWRNINYNR